MGGSCSTNGGEEEGVQVIGGKSGGKEPLGRPRRRRWIILGWILERWDRVMWTGLFWLRIETVGELL
jgi:hypothetical protein